MALIIKYINASLEYENLFSNFEAGQAVIIASFTGRMAIKVRLQLKTKQFLPDFPGKPGS